MCDQLINLIDKRFGRLTPIKYMGKSKNNKSLWLCLCDCGEEKIIVGDSLKNGLTKSCGCLQKELTKNRFTIHGQNRFEKRTKEYGIWTGMIKRCINKNCVSYKYYGGRGITVCDRWLPKNNGFANFFADMGECPPGLSLDRINNDKLTNGYSPENCRWSTRSQQHRNYRQNRLEIFDGRTQCIASWAEEFDLPWMVLYDRVYKLNWPIEKALTIPIRKHKKYKKKEAYCG